MLRILILSVVAILLATACAFDPPVVDQRDDRPRPYPAGCEEFDLSERRCTAIVAEMADRVGIDPATAVAIDLLGDPGCGSDPTVLCTRTVSFVVRVRFTLEDGRAPEESLFCGVGGQYSILCTEEPEVQVSSVTMGGYHDVPCPGEPPAGCATPVPTIDPVAAAAARPLRVDAMAIPLEYVGPYEVVLGEATLPNGLLTEASLRLAHPSPSGFLLTTSGVHLRVRSLEPGGGDLSNVYEHGWREGVEPVEAVLVFEVAEASPGAVLEVRDIVVR